MNGIKPAESLLLTYRVTLMQDQFWPSRIVTGSTPIEIEATRPRWLILAAMFCFLVGLAGTLSFLVGAAAIGARPGYAAIAWLIATLGALTAPAALYIGFGVLSGRQWARIGCILVCTLVAAGIAADIVIAMQKTTDAPLPTRLLVLGLLSMVLLAAGGDYLGADHSQDGGVVQVCEETESRVPRGTKGAVMDSETLSQESTVWFLEFRSQGVTFAANLRPSAPPILRPSEWPS